MRVVFFGSGEFGVPSLQWLIDGPHEVVEVVTQPDRPAGRGKKLAPTPIAQFADKNGIPAIRCENVNEDDFVASMRALKADIGIVIAFGQKIKEPARQAFPCECVNLHASLLPKYRGAAPIHAALLAGETHSGVTAFRLVDKMDAGPILSKVETPIGEFETCGELHDRLARMGIEVMEQIMTLQQQETLPAGEQQDESLVIKAPKLSKADGHLRFDVAAKLVAQKTRAFWPWPGARCRFVSDSGREEVVTFHLVKPIELSSTLPPGTLTDDLEIVTADGTGLLIDSVQPAGKRSMPWQDFVNGRHVKPGDRFEAME